MLSHFRRYPLAVCCVAIILSALLGLGRSGSTQIIAVISLGAIGILTLALSFLRLGRRLRPFRRSLIFGIIGAILALLSCYFVCTKRNTLPRSLADEGAECNITAYATKEGSDSAFGNTIVKVTEVDGKPCSFDLLLRRSNLASPKPYRYFSATVVFNTTDADLKQYTADNIAASAIATDITTSKKQVKTLSAFFYRLANGIDNSLQNHLNKDAYALARALLLGRRDHLPDTLKRDFRVLGISHTLAVSGMHLTVLLAGVLAILGKLRARKRLRFCVCLTLILLYAGICGFSPSILRAALMSLCLLAADAAGERTMGIRSLLLALGAILLFSPYLIFSVSLQLSALSTLGILLVFPLFHIKKKKHWARITHFGAFLLSQYCLTLCATVFTLPVMYYCFGSLSLVSPIANILFIPPITALLYLLPVFWLSTFLPFLPTITAFLVEKLCLFINWASGFAVHCKDLYCHIPITVLVLCALSLLAIPILYRLRIKHYLALCVLLLSLSLGVAYPFSLLSDANLFYRHDGKRETLLLCNENTVLLAETGNASGQNAYTALTECNKALQQTGIDHLLLTHYHTASTSFVEYLLENTYLETVFLPHPLTEKDTAIANAILESAKASNVKTHLYEQDETITVMDFSVKVHTEVLNRSEHPAQGIEIVCQNSRVLAADPALFELDGIGAVDLSGVDHLILLSSPPVDKYPLPLFVGGDGVHAVFGSYAQKNTIGCPFGSHTVLCPEDPYLCILFA